MEIFRGNVIKVAHFAIHAAFMASVCVASQTDFWKFEVSSIDYKTMLLRQPMYV